MNTEAALAPYASILVVVVMVMAIAGIMLLLAHVVRPALKGPVKNDTYESGMPVIGDARRRFNVRFYLVAMLFLLFDVEVVLLWPWAVTFVRAVREGTTLTLDDGMSAGPGYMLVAMGMFVALLVVGFIYEWRKGIFQWD